jgi:hypothetical protein
VVPGGEFIPLPDLDAKVATEKFRRSVLDRVHQAERHTVEFRETLLSWSRPGFSVFVGPPMPPEDPDRLERMARYLTRPPLAVGSVHLTPEGQVLISTPPDPRTGESAKILDPLEWIHAITTQIPDPHQHLTRFYGAYANRNRNGFRAQNESPPVPPLADSVPKDGDDSFTASRKKNWARLMRKILEVDPLRCARCGATMKVIAVITDPATVDKILAHLRSGRGPIEARAPPPASLSGA